MNSCHPGDPWGTRWPRESASAQGRDGQITDDGRWDEAGMSGGDRQRRDAAAGAGRAAADTYRD